MSSARRRPVVGARWLPAGAVLLLASVGAVAAAADISLTVETRARLGDEGVVCEVTVHNHGSEAAHNVQVHVELDGQRRSSEIHPLLAVDDRLTDTATLGGGAPGRHPVLVSVDYTDGAGHPFTALSSTQVLIGEDSPPRVFASVEPVELSFVRTLEVQVRNMDLAARRVRLRLVLPREIVTPEPDRELSLEPLEERTVEFVLRGISTLPGSVYHAYALVEYDEGGKHTASFAPTTLTIVESDPRGFGYRRYVGWGLAVLLVLLVALQLRRRRASGEAP